MDAHGGLGLAVGELAAFLGIAILVIVTPGQDTALTIRNTLLGGRAAGRGDGAGIVSGMACWTRRGERGPRGVARRLGAGLRRAQARRRRLPRLPRPPGAAPCDPSGCDWRWTRAAGPPLAPQRAFRQGLLSNLGNPKIAVFFTSLLPQFGSSFWSLLALGLLFCSLGLVWLSAYSLAVARAGDLLRRPRIRRSLDALTGTVLVAFGIRLAADR